MIFLVLFLVTKETLAPLENDVIHKAINIKETPGLLSYFKVNRNDRKVKNVSTRYIPQTEKMKKFYL